jgi:ketosteroid isomerase-like protein
MLTPPSEAQMAITHLVAKFDDAVNRRDVAEFSALWDADAVWEIGEPMPMCVRSAEAIIDTWQHMLGGTQWLFRGSFAGVMAISDNTATGRWPCIETGTFSDGKGYDNRAYYDDEYVCRDGQWLFAKRSYVYLWLSSEKIAGRAIAHSTHPICPS